MNGSIVQSAVRGSLRSDRRNFKIVETDFGLHHETLAPIFGLPTNSRFRFARGPLTPRSWPAYQGGSFQLDTSLSCGTLSVRLSLGHIWFGEPCRGQRELASEALFSYEGTAHFVLGRDHDHLEHLATILQTHPYRTLHKGCHGASRQEALAALQRARSVTRMIVRGADFGGLRLGQVLRIASTFQPEVHNIFWEGSGPDLTPAFEAVKWVPYF